MSYVRDATGVEVGYMYRLEDAAAPVFARHETFHPRYGWARAQRNLPRRAIA